MWNDMGKEPQDLAPPTWKLLYMWYNTTAMSSVPLNDFYLKIPKENIKEEIEMV